MAIYQHSVSLNVEKCRGCTHCLRHCPTEAIRIRNGRAVIDPYRCVDCGQCIRFCPYQAKKSAYDKLSDLPEGKWKVALPAPSLFGQFDNLDDINNRNENSFFEDNPGLPNDNVNFEPSQIDSEEIPDDIL